MNSNNSAFIIMMGPPGSGKGFLMEYIIRYLNKELNINIDDAKKTIIDDLIEQDDDFIIKTSEFIKKYWSIDEINNLKSNILDTIDSIVHNKPNELLNKLEKTSDELSKIYFETRKKYDNQNDNNIKKHLSMKNNIIFETTGQNNFDWLYDKFITKEIRRNYSITLVYPYVNRPDILIQAINRFIVQSNKILTGTDTWVRLPNIKLLYNSIDIIQQNFVSLLKSCQHDKNLLDYTLLYDNRSRYPNEPKLVLVNICNHHNTEKCDNISEFIKAIEIDKSSYDKLKSITCLKGGNGYHNVYYSDYAKYKSKYLKLKYINNTKHLNNSPIDH